MTRWITLFRNACIFKPYILVQLTPEVRTLQYLGDSLEVSGRHILEEDLVQEIVLMANPGVILMPGQTLPLTIFRPNVISLMKKLIDTTKVRREGWMCFRFQLYSLS